MIKPGPNQIIIPTPAQLEAEVERMLADAEAERADAEEQQLGAQRDDPLPTALRGRA